LKEEKSTRAYENTMLRKILGPKTEEAREGGEKCIKSSFKICDPHLILFG
jgi:hypothetical protein